MPMVLEYLRTKEIQQQYQELEKLHKEPAESHINQYIHEIINTNIKIPAPITKVHPAVLTDTQLEEWVYSQELQKGAKEFLWGQLHQPIHSMDMLTLRQQCIRDYIPNTTSDWNTIMTHEKDILWALHMPPLEKTWPLPLLYPQWFPIRWINRTPAMLNLYHLYRIYGAPLSHFIYPLTLLFGPWWYVRTKLKWKLPWRSYMNIVKTILLELVRVRSGNVKEAIYKIATLVVYVGIYVYTVIQSFDIAYMLHTVRKQLYERIKSIRLFISTVESIWNQNPSICENAMKLWNLPCSLPSIHLSDSIQSIYSLHKQSTIKKSLEILLCQTYVLQTIHVMSKYQKTNPKTTCLATWISGPSKLYGMGHPCLPEHQQRNPVYLKKNLIMTGPNAAGKTTYVRSMMTNYIMAQTFGICFAKKAWIQPVHKILSFMRVHDIIGTTSLYEAECKRSKELIDEACASKEPILLFLDEPMHATPPIEGASTAMAILKYLASMDHVRVIITTHYHVVTQLEKIMPMKFNNISMEAHIVSSLSTTPISDIQFSYKLQHGPSYQSIAIEMLQKDAFPKELLKDAIEFKNKICRVENK